MNKKDRQTKHPIKSFIRGYKDQRFEPEWHRLPMKQINIFWADKPESERKRLYGIVWYLEGERAKEILDKAQRQAKTYVTKGRNNYNKNQKTDLEDKIQGFAGELALISCLDDLGIKYQTAHKDFDSTEHKEPGDIILKLQGSARVIEVKTGRAYSTGININERHWRHLLAIGSVPDIIIAIKLLRHRGNMILVRFKGWCYGKDVTSFELRSKYTSYFYRRYEDLNPPKDIELFLKDLQ